jgi:protein-L-isoaspartate(D-aspartate) O-methyltransferase
MIDFALQRKNMVESQVRPSDITDRRIIRAMLDVAREKFCPAASAATAYMDLDVKVSPTRYLTATRVLAKLIQGLDVAETDHVLIVGGATGYTSAIMARLAAKVTALEADAGLAATLAQNVAELGLSNVLTATGALASGHAAGAPYDAILVDGAVADVPLALLDQLRDGGRLVAVVGVGRVGRITRWQRRGSAVSNRIFGDAGAPALPGFEKAAAFVF